MVMPAVLQFASAPIDVLCKLHSSFDSFTVCGMQEIEGAHESVRGMWYWLTAIVLIKLYCPQDADDASLVGTRRLCTYEETIRMQSTLTKGVFIFSCTKS